MKYICSGFLEWHIGGRRQHMISEESIAFSTLSNRRPNIIVEYVFWASGASVYGWKNGPSGGIRVSDSTGSLVSAYCATGQAKPHVSFASGFESLKTDFPAGRVDSGSEISIWRRD